MGVNPLNLAETTLLQTTEKWRLLIMENNGMTLVELQTILGERIRIATDANLSKEQKKEEMQTSQTIATLAKQMINNADVVLRANKLAAESNLKDTTIQRLVG